MFFFSYCGKRDISDDEREMLTKRQLADLTKRIEASDDGALASSASQVESESESNNTRAQTDDEAKRRRRANQVLKRIVREFVAKDDLIKNAERQLKELKKNRDQLREGIIAALQSAGMGACKLGAVPERAQPEVHLQVKARKLKMRPKKDEVIERIKKWMAEHGLTPGQAEEFYEVCIKAPVGEKDKLSLQRVGKKKGAPKKKAAKKKPQVPTMILANAQVSQSKDRPVASDQDSSESDSEKHGIRGNGEEEEMSE